MADLFNKSRRTQIMRRIASKDTVPEIRVRRILHRMGLRFRLHRKDLPGTPDIVLPRHRTVILVHGCFWHGHHCCEGHIPKTNATYWAPKLERNRRRDAENADKLRGLGWQLIVVWECQTYSQWKLEDRLLEAFAALPPERSTSVGN